MEIEVFIDDSAADTGDKRLFLCGYINTPDCWASFSTHWRRALNEPPRIEYLKMSEAFSFNGQFYGWSEIDRDKKVRHLADTIRKHSPLSVSCSVSRSDYAQIVGSSAPYFISRPYYVCFQMIIIGAARLLSTPQSGLSIKYIFDEQGQVGHDSAMFYEHIKNSLPLKMGNKMGGAPVFENDKNAPPLQAADMLAWYIRSEHEFPEREFLFPCGHIMGSQHGSFNIDRDVMERWAKNFSLLPGINSIKNRKSWSVLKKEIIKLRDRGIDPSKIKWPIKARAVYWIRKFKSKIYP
jgi:hypothetical protein